MSVKLNTQTTFINKSVRGLNFESPLEHDYKIFTLKKPDETAIMSLCSNKLYVSINEKWIVISSTNSVINEKSECKTCKEIINSKMGNILYEFKR